MKTIGVVGAGFSGTMVAAHLLRHQSTHVVLIDRTGRFGSGLAYSTSNASHLLNVPAGRMSAWPDRPDDFLRWGLSQGHPWAGGAFVPRREYGRYLQDTLNEAASGGAGTLERVEGEVVACVPTEDGVEIEWHGAGGAGVASGARQSLQRRTVDHVVLALGNFPPSSPSQHLASLPASVYAADPWGAGALRAIEPTAPVLLVGTGLTMLDMVLSLGESGHRGPIHAVSRRGLLPQPHRAPGRPASYTPPAGIDRWRRTTRGLLSHVRAEIAFAARRGVDWREVITSLRGVTPALWRSLSERHRAQFLRHCRAYWEVVRHRSAPSVDGRVQEMILSGRLTLHAGRIAGVAISGGEPGADKGAEAGEGRGGAMPTADGVGAALGAGGCDVCLSLRDGKGNAGTRTLRVARIINCTGPECDPARIDSPLLRRMLGEGVIERDPLGQGVRVDEHGRPLRAGGVASDRIWLIGPLAKGSAWEITAVPELREHAARVAREVAEASALALAHTMP